MLPRAIKRRTRPMWLAALGSAAWANRHDLQRWARFAQDAISERQQRPVADLVTEAKVRLAITMDPLLRRDSSLRDVEVKNGVVTLHADHASWPSDRAHFSKINRVKGVSLVETVSTPLSSDPTTTAGREAARKVQVAA